MAFLPSPMQQLGAWSLGKKACLGGGPPEPANKRLVTGKRPCPCCWGACQVVQAGLEAWVMQRVEWGGVGSPSAHRSLRTPLLWNWAPKEVT